MSERRQEMPVLTEDRMARLGQLCARHRVKQLELFGSAATGDFERGRSDLDFLVEFLPMPPTDHADCYFGLLESLQELFGCRVDLLETPRVDNPYFLEAIEPTRQVLYAA